MKIINSKKAPSAIGPYSHAVECNGFMYMSGQLGLDPSTLELLDGIEAQTNQVIKNIDVILSENNYDKDCVVKTTIFLKSMSDFGIVNKIYGEYFGEHKPARSTIQVASLPKDGLVEIEVIAFKK